MTSDGPSPVIGGSRHVRFLTILTDVMIGGFIVSSIVIIVTGLAASFLDSTALVWLGVWSGFTSLFSLPALAVLYLSEPRKPLKERSALVASADWFGRVVWSGLVFCASIVVGSVAGVFAARLDTTGGDSGADLGAVITSLSALFLWPILLAVLAIAYVVMGFRWCIDLGSIVGENRGEVVRNLVERRWTGTLGTSTRATELADLTIQVGLSFVSRGALIATLATVAVNLWIAISQISGK